MTNEQLKRWHEAVKGDSVQSQNDNGHLQSILFELTGTLVSANNRELLYRIAASYEARATGGEYAQLREIEVALGGEGLASNWQLVENIIANAAGDRPAKVTNLGVAVDELEYSVNWDAGVDAVGYELQVDLGVLIDNGNETSYDGSAGAGLHSVRVRAYNAEGVRSLWTTRNFTLTASVGDATLIGTWGLGDGYTHERYNPGAFTATGNVITFQNEAGQDIFRTHFVNGTECFIIEDDPTDCVLTAVADLAATGGVGVFGFGHSDLAVTGSRLRFDYRVLNADNDAVVINWTSNGTNLDAEDLSISGGNRYVQVRAISTSGIIGTSATSNDFVVTSAPLPDPIIDVQFTEGTGTTAEADFGPDWIVGDGSGWDADTPDGAGFSVNVLATTYGLIQANSTVAYNSNILSVGFWVKPNLIGGTQCLFQTRFVSGGAHANININASGILGCNMIGTGGGFLQVADITTLIIVDDVWQYITVVFDGSTNEGNIYIYVNGVIGSDLVRYVDGRTSNDDFATETPGLFNAFVANAEALVTDVRVWNVALTSDQVLSAMARREP